ncbi:MAG: alpha/beta hydrolase [Lachnospiraceae bacterium]|nr:alpha/beta hydrolase [Lachnospiraceae bacterium]
MKRKDFYIPSRDGVHRLRVVLWEPEGEVRAVVQISHGMIEMIDRYEDFALFLNKHGYAVIGNDHLGHGLTAGNDADLGYFCPRSMSATVVADLHRVTKYARKKYKNKPYFLLGHSMGSFMARRYLMTYGMDLDGAIICGTGSQSWPVLIAGPIVANALRLVFGDRFRSRLLEKSAFGAYQKRIPNPRTKSDWMTRDTKIVDFCRSNKYCSFIFTVNGYRTLFEVLAFIQKKQNIDRIPTELPMFFIAGGQDPVGHYGRDVRKVAARYERAGVEDVSLKIYQEDRHEVLNELDRDQVYRDVLSWLDTKVLEQNDADAKTQ